MTLDLSGCRHIDIDGEHWLRELDVSIARSLAEIDAGGGIDLDLACRQALADLGTAGTPHR